VEDEVVVNELGDVYDLEKVGVSNQIEILKGRECDLSLNIIESMEEVGSFHVVFDRV